MASQLLRSALLLLAATAPAVLAQTTPSSTSISSSSTPSCATGIHLIVARGSTEPRGLGRIGVVAGNVTALVPGSTVAAVDYPATLDGYFASEGLGVAAMTAMIAAYVVACPTSKIALLGYSQGGQVAMDVVCGTSETLFAVTPDLSEAFGSNIIAIVTFGDPSHKAGMPWNEGTSNKTGIFQRANTTACEPYSPMIRAWCDTGDIYCDHGNLTGVHGTYFANYTTDAAEFIVGRFNESKASSSSPSPTGTVSPTSSQPATNTNAAGLLRPGSLGMGAFLAVAGASFGNLL